MQLSIEEIELRHERMERVTEHGQDWLSCGMCGALYSIADTDQGEEAELIEEGDDSCATEMM